VSNIKRNWVNARKRKKKKGESGTVHKFLVFTVGEFFGHSSHCPWNQNREKQGGHATVAAAPKDKARPGEILTLKDLQVSLGPRKNSGGCRLKPGSGVINFKT